MDSATRNVPSLQRVGSTKWLTPLLEVGFYKTIDLSGDELSQPVETFRPLYRMAKEAG